jgi:hypothetical protein
MEPIEFLAVLPNIQSAIKVGPDESDILLRVPRTFKPEVLKLGAFGFDKVLKVTITEDDSNGAGY